MSTVYQKIPQSRFYQLCLFIITQVVLLLKQKSRINVFLYSTFFIIDYCSCFLACCGAYACQYHVGSIYAGLFFFFFSNSLFVSWPFLSIFLQLFCAEVALEESHQQIFQLEKEQYCSFLILIVGITDEERRLLQLVWGVKQTDSGQILVLFQIYNSEFRKSLVRIFIVIQGENEGDHKSRENQRFFIFIISSFYYI